MNGRTLMYCAEGRYAFGDGNQPSRAGTGARSDDERRIARTASEMT